MHKRELKAKQYKNARDYEHDAKKMLKDGWTPQDQTDRKGKVAVGTTVRNAVLTGGIGLLLGGRAHKADKMIVTWVRGGEPDTKVCPNCAESVMKAAKVCHFCQHSFLPDVPA